MIKDDVFGVVDGDGVEADRARRAAARAHNDIAATELPINPVIGFDGVVRGQVRPTIADVLATHR